MVLRLRQTAMNFWPDGASDQVTVGLPLASDEQDWTRILFLLRHAHFLHD